MKKRISIVAVFLICLSLTLSASSLSAPAATVNLIRNKAITVQELEKELQGYKDAGIDITAQEVLQQMINTEVFMQGAERDGVTISDRQIDILYNQVYQSAAQSAAQSGHNLTPEAFEEEVINQIGSVAAYKETLKKQQLIQSYLMQVKGDEIEEAAQPTDAEIRSYYRLNQQQFFQPECVKLAHVYLQKAYPTDPESETDKAEAAQYNSNSLEMLTGVSDQIKRGELTFEKAVSLYSEDEGSKLKGGDIGWLTMINNDARKGWGDEFCDTLLSMDDGEVSEVLESYMGYHIVKVTVHLDAKLLRIDDPISPEDTITVYQYIAEGLANQNAQKAMSAALQEMTVELRNDARIRILYKD